MARKYERGKQIKSVGEFEQSKSLWFMVRYGVELKTTHRGFLISWQYHLLDRTIRAGRLFEAVRKDGEDGTQDRPVVER